jgi:sigma-B regulation protein RsbU (phosphoserine phosphatase)
MVMGLFASVFYPLKSIRLEPGDLLALYSDGVTEAAGVKDAEFGEDGLSAFLQKHRHLTCDELSGQLVEHVRSYCGSTSFADDFTILLVKRH